MNCTYILRCADGTLYTGWTNNLEQRLAAHNSGRGAKYTRSRRPVLLVYAEAFATRGEAMRREAQIKKLSRAEKQKLVEAAGGQDRKILPHLHGQSTGALSVCEKKGEKEQDSC
jgi:putative endonuclease